MKVSSASVPQPAERVSTLARTQTSHSTLAKKGKKEWTCDEVANLPQATKDRKCSKSSFYSTCRETCEFNCKGRKIEINFEEAPGDEIAPYFRSDIQIENFYSVSGIKKNPGSGYEYGTISPPYVGFNYYGFPATITCPNGSFSLNSLWMTAAWRDNLPFRLDGYDDDGILVSTFVTTLPFTTEPQYYESELSDFKDLERLVISHDIDTDEWVVFDDIKIDITSPCTVLPPQEEDLPVDDAAAGGYA